MQKRILTTIVGIPFAIYVINFGQWLFATVICCLALSAWLEFQLMMSQGRAISVWSGLGFAGTALLLACAWTGNFQQLLFVIVLVLFAALVRVVFRHDEFNLDAAALTIMGILYIGLTFSHLLLLRFAGEGVGVGNGFLSYGAEYLWLAFIGTWASDTFAYLVGSQWGRHKLAPRLSPGKTVEGAVGGLLGSMISVSVLGCIFAIPLAQALSVGVLVGVTAPIGDLVESAMKRFAGVKDSGHSLPGHGGILDRFDGIMFAVPAVYYYAVFFVFT